MIDGFDRRTPPPGGLDRLARAIAQPRRHEVRWAMPAAAFGGALCVALSVLLHVRDAPRREFEMALRHALDEVRTPPDGGLRELPSGRADVRILLLPARSD